MSGATGRLDRRDRLDLQALGVIPRRRRGAGAVILIGLLLAAAVGWSGRSVVFSDPPPAAPVPAPRPVVMGALPYWDQEDALASLERHPGVATVASPWIYRVAGDGSVQLQESLNAAAEQALLDRTRRTGVQLIPTVANTTAGLWDESTVAAVLADPALRSAHVRALVGLIRTHGFDGIQIDYENLHGDDRAGFSAFVTELGQAVHAIGSLLFVTVHVKEDDVGYDQRNAAQDYAVIGAAADRVCLMAYDWHWETSPAGPIAPYDWVRRVVDYAVTQIPAEKLVLGVALFGYDWVGTKATNLTWSQITALAGRNRADEYWDIGSQSPHFSYVDGDGVSHEVWYENDRSIESKLDLARVERLAGVALWRLGGEDPGIWKLMSP